MKKTERQLLIKQIILNNEVSTQDELLEHLSENGVRATQATISRDIKELNLVKTSSSDGKLKYTIYQNNQVTMEEKLNSTIRSVVVEVAQVQFINVVKTLPGNAHVIGALVDDIHYPEVVGSVAGNDTIVLISKTEEEAKTVFQHFDGELQKVT
ncbi:arginine repressor [Alkalibacterium kapii]|uniref:Arginine repressor n=1 Tax=Alkalibacterium kapii TaxID=426704 RepID=A0A511AR06_9LACT|nr:arginine repressor [Alkalibacterium kapii]GEK90629.1 arginine repressor [Alkalibacterium kapii]